jgi:hypothetical protein
MIIFNVGFILGLIVGITLTLLWVCNRLTSLAARGFINPGWRFYKICKKEKNMGHMAKVVEE